MNLVQLVFPPVFFQQQCPFTVRKLPPLLNAKTMKIHHLPSFLTQNKYLAISAELFHISLCKYLSKT